MDDQPGSSASASDSASFAGSVAEIGERSRRLVSAFLDRQAEEGFLPSLEPLRIGAAFLEMSGRLMADPARVMQAQVSLWQDYLALWQNAAGRMLGAAPRPLASPDAGDRRFRDEAWSEIQVFDFIKQSYLLTSRWLEATVAAVDGLDEDTARKIDFYTRQFVNAISPSNFVVTNPEVLRATVESGGENLINGLKNLLEDLEAGKGNLRIRMTDERAFEVGRDVATTAGKVMFRNDLMELIQFEPTTARVRRRPLVIVPPWINKYYILDLRPENSFIRFAVECGHTVFVLSWVNPDERLSAKTFEDYMLEGPLAALDLVHEATGEREVNALGYCIGGTLLACTLAYMACSGDDRIRSATFLATMVDFEEAGELGVFVDETQVRALEERMQARGYLEGRDMANTFNLLRSNDLIWSFVVNNYLLGKEPFPFDLLYWNADSTRMPAAMHSFYLRKMYLENRLVEPRGIRLADVPIDLRRVRQPTYIVATREDHIAPWTSAYGATRLYSGPMRFVLSASGHIAGVINPPDAGKYCYRTNPKTPRDPEKWLAGARCHQGSWWPDWARWLARHAGRRTVTPRRPGDAGPTPIEDAPGRYVRMRAD